MSFDNTLVINWLHLSTDWHRGHQVVWLGCLERCFWMASDLRLQGWPRHAAWFNESPTVPSNGGSLLYTSDTLHRLKGTEREKQREILRLSETACAFPVIRLPTAERTGEQNKVFVQTISDIRLIVVLLVRSEVIKGLKSHIQDIWKQG